MANQFIHCSKFKTLCSGWRGAQKYGQHIGAYTAHIYKRILSSEFMHSVRDSFTEEQLRSVGINNVINTGCPTMWG